MKSKQSKHKINMIQSWKNRIETEIEIANKNREHPGTTEWYVTYHSSPLPNIPVLGSENL